MQSNEELKSSFLRTVEMQRINPDFDPVEHALDQCSCCLIVPTECPDDPNVIGPFDYWKEAEIWAQSYPHALVRLMASPEFEVLIRRESEENEAFERPKN